MANNQFNTEIVTLKYHIVSTLILSFILLSSGCSSEISKLKQENIVLQQKILELQQDKLNLQQKNNELSNQLNALQGQLDEVLDNKIKQTKQRTLKANLVTLRASIIIYYGEHEKYPDSLNEVATEQPDVSEIILNGDWTYNSITGKVLSKSHPDW